MKKASFFLPALIFISLLSCNKSTDNGPGPLPDRDFMALKVGNYWIYQNYEIDTNGIGIPTDDWDSAYIQKDTLINAVQYFKMIRKAVIVSNEQYVEFLRDSSGYLVNHHGLILMSENNFTDTLYQDTMQNIPIWRVSMMAWNDSTVSVPAGTFVTKTMRTAIIPLDTNMHFPTRYIYNIYGEGIGKILSHSFFLVSDKHFDARLERYHLEP